MSAVLSLTTFSSCLPGPPRHPCRSLVGNSVSFASPPSADLKLPVGHAVSASHTAPPIPVMTVRKICRSKIRGPPDGIDGGRQRVIGDSACDTFRCGSTRRLPRRMAMRRGSWKASMASNSLMCMQMPDCIHVDPGRPCSPAVGIS